MAILPFDENHHHNLSDYLEIEMFVIEVPENYTIMIGSDFLAHRTVVPLRTQNFSTLLDFIVQHRKEGKSEDLTVSFVNEYHYDC